MINGRRVLAMVFKEMLQVWRDPRSLAFALIMPLMQMVLLGYGVSLDIKHVPLCVFDQENSQASRTLVEQFAASNWFRITSVLTRDRSIRGALDSGTCIGALVIPVNFSRELASTGVGPIQLVFDATDTNTTNIAIGYAQGVIARANAILARDLAQRRGTPLQTVGMIDLEPRVWFNEGLDSRNFIIPGAVAVILALIGAQLTSLTVSREWERGTMEQLISTPVTPLEVMIGKLVPYFVIGAIDAAFCLGMAVYWYHVPLRGSWIALTITTCLFIAVVLAIGYLISVRIKSQIGAGQVALLVTMLPTTLLSGYTFPIDQMPAPIRAATVLIYARYFVTILRAVFLKGSSLVTLATPELGLIVYTVIVLWLAARAFHKRLD